MVKNIFAEKLCISCMEKLEKDSANINLQVQKELDRLTSQLQKQNQIKM